ncbi:MAG: tetratricopeptide repeat protein [Burkholderiales bacterium]
MDGRLTQVQERLGAGDAAGARTLAGAVLAEVSLGNADRFAALMLRARANELLRDLALAIADVDAALAIDPGNARAWNELGILCADAGDTGRAIEAFTRATRADPGYARGWNNLGNALKSAERPIEALSAFERAVSLDAKYALAWANLGAMLRVAGDDHRAEEALRRALAIDPSSRVATMALAGLLHDKSQLEAAAELFLRAARSDPKDASACLELAQTLAERDDLDRAREAYAEAERRDPRMLRAAIGRSLALPMVAESAATVAASREAYARGLEALERALPARASGMAFDARIDELRWTNFLLAYQGEDDRALQSRYGALVDGLTRPLAPPLPSRASGGARIKVGFAGAFFRDGTAGRYFERWITDLPRDTFEVFVYHLAPGLDALGQRIAARADHVRHCPRWRPSQVAPHLLEDALDVLVYPELGMAAVTFALAALRLAPLQCAAWGHPVTSGLPAIDVFFSSACMEPADGASHYSERLVTLPGIGTRYAMPAAHPPDRARLGLPESAPLLLCPQSLFKIHPDNDALFARVLDAVPEGVLVLYEGRDPVLTTKFRSRLLRAGIDDARVRFIPQRSHEAFLAVNASCDVMLDTLRWSGGNTSLDAIASALPIVTLPGSFMRGRQSAGMLRTMGLDELVAGDADDYVRKAAAVATDRAYRGDLSRRIADARGRIFDDASPVAALAEFLAQGARR